MAELKPLGSIESQAAASKPNLVQHLASIAKTVRQLHYIALQDLPVVAGQDQLLLLLMRDGTQSGVKLADKLNVRPSTISKMISICERRGFLHRHHNSMDHRNVFVTLTPEGTKLARELQDTIAGFEKDLEQHLAGHSEIHGALAAMDKVLSRRLSRLR